MVLILVGILAVSMWPRAPSTESITIHGRAEQLASDIRYVQTLSMTRGERFCLRLTNSGYSLNTTDAGNNCELATEPHPAGLEQPIAICSGCMSWTNLPADLVQFNGLGTPYTAPAVTLGGDAVITIAEGGQARTVTISPATGRVLVQ